MSPNKFSHIESLRAIAVILVVVYHSGFDILTGGFVGVDMFLVISGFLMSFTVYGRDNKFYLLTFYSKRLMRLYPHLAVMLLSISLLSYFILPPYLLSQSAQSAVAAILSVSNGYFLLQSEYFGPESLVSPFIHTWSLGLEVQFYIIFGLIVAFASKRNAVISLFLVSGISFMQNLATVNLTSPSAYFMLPSRFWEFGVGSLIYFLPGVNGLIAGPRVKGIFTEIVLKCIVILALLILVLSSYYFHSDISFPGYYALVPVTATALLVILLPNVPSVNNFLKTKWLVFIGGISYGLYLWHQPLFALTRVYFLNEPPVFALIVALSLSILLSAVLKMFIEDKLMGRSFFEPRVLITMAAAFISIASFGYFSTITSGFKGRLNNFPSSSSYFYDVEFEKNSGEEILRLTSSEISYEQKFSPDSVTKRILLIGDSMAHDVAASLAHFEGDENSKLEVRLFRIESDCFYFSIYTDACQSKLDQSLSVTESLSPDHIFVSALWKKGADFEKISDYIQRLKISQGRPLTLMGSTGFNDIFSLAYAVSSLAEEVDDDHVAELTYNHRRSKFEFGNQRILDLSRSLGVAFWDRKAVFCSDFAKKCNILRGNQRPYIWDNAHLTSTGMKRTSRYIRENLDEIFRGSLK
jgi:peptidoglycan/LPS O-acetylase OafA/YrhL